MAETRPPVAIGGGAFGRKKLPQKRRIQLPLKCAKATCVLGSAAACGHCAEPLLDVLQAMRGVTSLRCRRSGNQLILLAF
jgi:hypothetical protein